MTSSTKKGLFKDVPSWSASPANTPSRRKSNVINGDPEIEGLEDANPASARVSTSDPPFISHLFRHQSLIDEPHDASTTPETASDIEKPDSSSPEPELEVLKQFLRPGIPKAAPPSGPEPQFQSIQPAKKPYFEVIVPSRSIQLTKPGAAVPRLVEPSSTPSKDFAVVVPLSQTRVDDKGTDAFKAKRNDLLKELRRSTAPVKDRLPLVERYVGQTGFSTTFDIDDVECRLQKLAIKSEREVKRDNVKLDWPTEITRNEQPRPKIRHPAKQVKEVLTARFKDIPGPPLTFDNKINDRQLNGKFQFVDRYLLGPSIKMAPANTNHGCGCLGYCDTDVCSCLSMHTGGSERVHVKTYTQRADGIVVLEDDYMRNELDATQNHYEISECNERCGCHPDCWNRNVGRGRTVRLEVFETANCGFGVRSADTIWKGQFIDLYLGEVITSEELERRENSREDNAPSYIYSLDWFKVQDCLHVDGEFFGGAMRYVNHRCSPNARNFTVRNHKADKNVYYLAFFAIEDIPAGTEITIDYSPQEQGRVEEIAQLDDDEAEDTGRARCYCGAPNCRKWLWRGPGRQRRKRKTTKHD